MGKKTILYIVYGNNQDYYHQAKFSILSLLNWVKDSTIQIVVLSEQPEKFSDYPIITIAISQAQKNTWSLDGKYHLRIKNRGLDFVIQKLCLTANEKILFFDTDIYFHQSPLKLFDFIKKNQAVLYQNEGRINKKKRFDIYTQSLAEKTIVIDHWAWQLSAQSVMWSSAIIGINVAMLKEIELADKLILSLINLIPAHTIEQFALAESLTRKYNIVAGKSFASIYSTYRRKQHALTVLSDFFKRYQNTPINEQIKRAQQVKLNRPLDLIISQHITRHKRINQFL